MGDGGGTARGPAGVPPPPALPEAALRQAIEALPLALLIVDDAWVVRLANAGLERLLERARSSLVGHVLWDAVPQARAPEVRVPLLQAMAARQPVAFSMSAPPSRRRFHILAAPCDGGLAICCRDVTVREQAIEHLRLLDSCVRHLNDGVMITDADPDPPGPRIVFVNEAIFRLCGWRPQELIGRSPRLLQGPLTQRDRLDAIRSAILHARPVETELINYHRDGRMYWVEIKVSPILDDEGRCTHFVAIERDITQRKQAQAQHEALQTQLRQAQKIESIGTLAGGIAHDFNNILGSILGNASLIEQTLTADSALRPALGHIQRAGLRGRALVQQILAFGRQQPTLRVAQPLGPLVQDTLALLRGTLPASVQLECRVEPHPLWAQVDGNQLQQVLLNLCTNAWHALPPAGGLIVVGLDEVPADTAAGTPDASVGGAQAHLWVADNGSGMDARTQARIFEPFFTTKPPGQGTGLGLSVAHGIVVAHGGRIVVDSAPGRGSVFHVYLPASAPPAQARAPVATTPAGVRRLDRLRVLCVDDDPVVLLTQSALLERAGCEVTGYDDPAAALAALRAAPADFDALVTDQTMPGLSGLDLARAAFALRPDLVVVLVSGFVTDELRSAARSLGVSDVVHKESSFEDLVGALCRAAASRAAEAAGGAAPPGED